jgi:hypothetical protein
MLLWCDHLLAFPCRFRVGLGFRFFPSSDSYGINIFSSFIILGHLIGFSINLSIVELGPTTPNVNDRVYCLSSRNCMQGESEASFNVDIIVLIHDVVLCVQLCIKFGLV